jgi:hypothetical protein
MAASVGVGPTGAPAGPPLPVAHVPSRRPLGGWRTTTTLVAVAILLVASLALPWWSEREVFGDLTWEQEFSIWTGISGSCRPSCGLLVDQFPVNGTRSFANAGLHQTGDLYLAEAAFVVAAAVLTALAALLTRRTTGEGRPALRWRRIAMFATAAAVVALPVGQPLTLTADTSGSFGSGALWTPSPSPETSFWGGCLRGFNGLCASGGSAAWGPALGWDLIALAFVLLVVLEVARLRRGAKAES